MRAIGCLRAVDGRLEAAWVRVRRGERRRDGRVADWETIPFHFVWISLTLVYGFRVWAMRHDVACWRCRGGCHGS